MPSILTERFNVSPMTYLAESKDSASPFLAYFEGPAADYKNPTRNSRKYPLALWQRVVESDDFKEAMQTRTCLGELNHPFDDSRLEIDLREVAIVLLDLQIRDDGTIWAKFGILDTPNGRLLKTLLDSGCQIGVSSRGTGDLCDDPEEGSIVEADTYYFVCFDAVVTPAVITARPSMHESYDPSTSVTLTESINTQINDAKSLTELSTIQSVLESLNVPDMDAIKASIDIKSTELSKNGDNISSGLASDLAESLKTNEELAKKINLLEATKSADDIRIKKLEELVESFRSSSKSLRAELLESHNTIDRLSNDLVDSASQCESISNDLESLTEDLHAVTADRDKLLERYKVVTSRSHKLTEMKSNVDDCKSKLSESASKITSLTRRCNQLTEANNKLSNELHDVSSSVSALESKNKNLKSQVDKTMKSYIHLHATKSGISESLILDKLPKSFTSDDVDKVVESIVSYADRIKKMPISINENLDARAISMKINTPTSDEDTNTLSVLSHFK